MKRRALAAAAIVSRRTVGTDSTTRDLCPAPEGSGLRPITGDRGTPGIGHVLEAATEPIDFLQSRLATFGPVSWMRAFTMPIVLALGPEATEEVLTNKDHAFSQKGQEFFSGRFFDRGLMFLDFDEHRRHRRIMQEAFTRERLRGYVQTMEAVSGAAAATLGDDAVLQAYPYVKRTLLDIAATVFTGDAPGPERDLVSRASADCLRAASAVIRIGIPGLRWSAGVRGRRDLEGYFRARIDARRLSGGADLFSALCHARDEDGNRLSDDDIVNHMIFLMAAAIETTAAAATAVLHQLALYPQWQDCVRAEAAAVAGTGPLDSDALERMHSLQMVIDESIRLFPPVPVMFRKALRDSSIHGHFVPAGALIAVAPLLNHHMPQLWSAPSEFDPDRFADSRREDRSHRLAFVPFGAGAHKCIGMHFAIDVVKVVIWHLLREHRIELRPGYTLDWDLTAMPAPTDDFPVLLRRTDALHHRNTTVSA